MLLTKHSNVTKVWDAATGLKQYTFEGHEAPVYSVCPHYKENIQVFVGFGTFDKITIGLVWENVRFIPLAQLLECLK